MAVRVLEGEPYRVLDAENITIGVSPEYLASTMPSATLEVIRSQKKKRKSVPQTGGTLVKQET